MEEIPVGAFDELRKYKEQLEDLPDQLKWPILKSLVRYMSDAKDLTPDELRDFVKPYLERAFQESKYYNTMYSFISL